MSVAEVKAMEEIVDTELCTVVDAYQGDTDKLLEKNNSTPLCCRSHRQAVRVEAGHQTEEYY